MNGAGPAATAAGSAPLGVEGEVAVEESGVGSVDGGNVAPGRSVSVVIPCKDCAEVLPTQLRALARQEWPAGFEVLLADNSPPGSAGAQRMAELVADFRPVLPGLRVVDASGRRGAAAARNVGVRAGTGDYVLFCDADDEVADGWLPAMATALDTAELVAASLDRNKLNAPWTVRAAFGLQGLSDSTPPFLPYAFAAALGVRREVHLAAGGFDEDFSVACEDRDYCYRLQLAGARLVLAPGALVHYRLRDTFGGIYRNGRAYATGSVLLYRTYRDRGLRRPHPLRSAASWVSLLPRLLPALRSRRAFGGWCYQLGWLVGRLQGSWRYRIVSL